MEMGGQLQLAAALVRRQESPVNKMGPRIGLDALKKRIICCPYRKTNRDSMIM
jgi:hypothetical protein